MILALHGGFPAKLHPAVKSQPREHHGDLALLALHGPATDPTEPLAPNTAPGIQFYALRALATLRGTMAAVHGRSTPAGMDMGGFAQSGHEAYRAHVSGVGTSQEGEATILLSYVRRFAEKR